MLFASKMQGGNLHTYVYFSCDTSAVGATAWVAFNSAQDFPATNDTIRLYMYDVNNTCPQPTLIWKANFNDLYKYPKVYRKSNNDSVNKAVFIVPNLCNIGDCYISAVNTTTIFIKSSVTGIKSYSVNDFLIRTEYFNLFGQPIEVLTGICIEKRYYNSGTITQRKVIRL